MQRPPGSLGPVVTMAGTVFTVASWLAALYLAAVTVSAAIRIARRRRTDGWLSAHATAGWMNMLLWGCAAVAVFTALGVLAPLIGGLLAVALLAVGLAAAWRVLQLRGVTRDHLQQADARRVIAGILAGQLRRGPLHLADHLRMARRHLERAVAEHRGSPAAAPAPAVPATTAAPAPPPAPARTNGGTSMAAPAAPNGNGTRQQPAVRARRLATRDGKPIPVPPEWQAVVAAIIDFQPGDNQEFLDWMLGLLAGVAACGEAVVELHETLTTGIGVDAAAITAVHDVADGFVANAETVGTAVTEFTDYFELPQEHVDQGRQMTHDGHWITATQ
jgi:hypothetical protein